MTDRRRTVIFLVVALVISLSSCAKTNDALENTEWRLASLGGSPPIQGREATLSFGASEISGTTGCNHYGGGYEATESSLTLSGVYQTEMACVEPAGIMAQEQAYLLALNGVASYRLYAERLELFDEDGALLLAFVASTTAAPSREDAPATTSPELSLDCALRVDQTFAAGEPVRLRFELRNRTDRPLHVLTWYTPLEGLAGEIFQVTRDGAEVPYQGALAKRGDPFAEEYITLEPGEAASATIDLALGYDLSTPGSYHVQFAGGLRDVVDGASLLPRTRDDHQPHPLACNAVQFDIVAPAGDDWPVSTPAAQGLDPRLLAALYDDAAEMETLYGLVVAKNGHLIAEAYYNGGAREQRALLQSASKSIISALVGIALEQGHLSSLDQEMLDFFPDVADRVADPRKAEITIRQMLQMRSGYPDEETGSAYMEALYWGEYLPLIDAFPLVSDPGTDFNYSNLTSSWLAIILARACEGDLKDYAQEHLFAPIGVEVGDWLKDRDGHYIGSGGIHLTARAAARFGELYLNEGKFEGKQIIPAEWVHESLQTYSEDARDYGRSVRFRDFGYGYQWWSARAGDHRFNFAWGHGGQLIVLLDELDIVIVTTADPFLGQHDDQSWTHERAIMNLVGDFVESLPTE